MHANLTRYTMQTKGALRQPTTALHSHLAVFCAHPPQARSPASRCGRCCPPSPARAARLTRKPSHWTSLSPRRPTTSRPASRRSRAQRQAPADASGTVRYSTAYSTLFTFLYRLHLLPSPRVRSRFARRCGYRGVLRRQSEHSRIRSALGGQAVGLPAQYGNPAPDHHRREQRSFRLR